MKLVSVAEMKSIEQEANASGFSYRQMMEAAGSHLAEVVQTLYVPDEDNIVIGLVGSGNNGGDTLVALSYLKRNGWQVRVYLAKKRQTDDTDLQKLVTQGIEVVSAAEDKNFEQLDEWMITSSVLIDGVLGTGIQLPVTPEIADVLTFVRDHQELPLVIAVDCPSGMDCDTGIVDNCCLPADITVCMEAIKSGMLKFPAYAYLGDLQVVPIDLPDDFPMDQFSLVDVIDQDMVEETLPDRDLDAHKGTFGTALIVAGSMNYTGAAYLAGKAAYRVGTGLVRMAIPGPLHTPLAAQLPEATWLLLPHVMGVIAEDGIDLLGKNMEKVSAMLIGPGLGSENTTGQFIRRFLNKEIVRGAKQGIGFVTPEKITTDDQDLSYPPLVLDADALNLLAKNGDWFKLLPEHCVLTPHPGEMAALTGLSVEEIQADRIQLAKRYAAEWHQIVVLKGAMTVVAAPEGICAVLPVATPALAKAGTGDVLSGMIVGLLAQGMAPYQAAVAGVWLHAQAGLVAESWHGTSTSVIASDLLDALSEVFSSLW
jgi:NAD(P)H-hydrate epimerase